MKSKTIKAIGIFILGTLLLSACSGIGIIQTDTTPTLLPPVKVASAMIAEGRIVPNRHVKLAFKTNGQVAEILVEEGEIVEVGEVIARLEDSEQFASAAAAAEVELLNAKQALDVLHENANVTEAQARQAVTDARDAVRDAERYLDNLRAGSRQTDIDEAEANVIILEDKLKKAQDDYAQYANKKKDSVVRATYQTKLADAQRKYDNAVSLLNNLTGNPAELDIAIAEANLAVAQAQLAIDEKKYADLQNGVAPDDLAAAETRLRAAEMAQVAAQAALDNLSLVAPFSGTVADLQLEVGEQVALGKAVATLVDFSVWVVETTDLSEIEVPRVSVGQSVTIGVDALPDLELIGTVESIGLVFTEKSGEITYTARIILADEDPRLRWGMTTVVTFDE
ncbi:MAG TPA: HlyD family efflux transporter periplasmic adaptor subunit [Anaerolineales bacterium]|nr:HlyD family efflux transporter periplasmic adaptor subunit [Anaerolineales bacterium]